MTYFVGTRRFDGGISYSLCANLPAAHTKEQKRAIVAVHELSPVGEHLSLKELITCYERDGFKGPMTANCIRGR